MHIEEKNPLIEFTFEDTILPRTKEKKDLGELISDDCKMSKQCGLVMGKAQRFLGCLARRITRKRMEVLIPLYTVDL